MCIDVYTSRYDMCVYIHSNSNVIRYLAVYIYTYLHIHMATTFSMSMAFKQHMCIGQVLDYAVREDERVEEADLLLQRLIRIRVYPFVHI